MSREKIIKAARSHIGRREADGSHRKIIDIYNSHKPLARGYVVTYTDAWCATFVSALAISCELTDIIPTECSCDRMIALFKARGDWVENDSYTPRPGDVIFYDWADTGAGDNRGASDHVGIVETVNGRTLTIIEGNINNAVGRRNIKVNGRYIRGYGVPKYPEPKKPALRFKVGDAVEFVGSRHYTTASSSNGLSCKPGKARVSATFPAGKHPYHLIRTSGGRSTVYGWVDAADVSAVEAKPIQKGDKVKVLKAKTYTGGTFKTYYDTYDVIQVNGDRVVIGQGKTVTAAVHKGNLQRV